MARNEEIIRELQEISPGIAEVPVQMPYSIPESYFSVFAQNTLIKIKSTHQVQQVPEGYFENFAVKMASLVKYSDISSELSEVAPFLNKLPKNMPFVVPEGYFENKGPSIQKEVQPQSKAKVISLFGSKARNWAAAAAVTVGLLAGGWWFFNQTLVTENENTASTQATDPVTQQLEDINPNEMMAYLNQEDRGLIEFASTLFSEEESLEKQLKNIQTDELVQYLKTETQSNKKS